MLTIPVTILSTIYMTLLMVAYFSKDRISNIENKIYSNMIKLSFIGIILDTISCLFVIFGMTESIYFRLVTILIFMYYILWSGLFVLYTFTISFKKADITDQEFVKRYGKILNIAAVFFLICALVVPLMPLNYHMVNNAIYPEGLSVNFTYFIAGFLAIVLMLILMAINRKNIKSKKYIPGYLLIILFLVAVVIQQNNPQLILTTSIECFITFIMYFTIENPDLKMINELNRNKSIIEKNSQSTSNFMFNLTTESRQYINTIMDISNKALQINEEKYYAEAIKDILTETKEAETKVNSIMDVSAIDIKNIKISNKEYSIIQLLDEIRMQNENRIADNINFVTNIASNLPDKLYGDKIRLKQVISSLLTNAIKNTEDGFISLEVNAIIKYDVCRIILSIEDSGCGLNLEKVNDILSYNDDISSEELAKIDTLDMNLKMIKKVIKMLGGSLLLTSKEGKGTKVTIVLDQRIVNAINPELESKISDYSKKLGFQKVLIVDDNLKELNTIQEYCNDMNVETVGTMYGEDCIDRIRVGQVYDVIILDDSMNKTNAIDILQELKRNENFKTPVIIMLEEKKLSIAKHYLNDGFADYIDKTKLDVGIKRIIDKYLN